MRMLTNAVNSHQAPFGRRFQQKAVSAIHTTPQPLVRERERCQPLSLSLLRPELLLAVADGAERDAGRVIEFLAGVGLAPEAGQVRRLPADLLLDLGAALRMLSWEYAGFAAHLEAGLPPAREAIRRAFLDAAAGNPPPARRLCEAVIRLAVDRFAWAGHRDVKAEILLDVPDEDALVEAMARFLWDHRHATTHESHRGTQP